MKENNACKKERIIYIFVWFKEHAVSEPTRKNEIKRKIQRKSKRNIIIKE